MGILAVAVVYAAARYNGDIGVFPDIEVVVDQIVHTAMGDDCRNVYGFTLGAGLDHNVNARLVRLGDNLDILRVLTGCTAAVRPDIVGADCRQVADIRYLAHQIHNQVIAVHLQFPPLQQPQGAAVSSLSSSG